MTLAVLTKESSNVGHCSNELSLGAQLAGRVVSDFYEYFLFLEEGWKLIGPLHLDCISHANS